jgi:hypothetical protein
MTTTTFECGRCSGAGRILAFSHYASGLCFACGGTGTLDMPEATASFVVSHPIRETVWWSVTRDLPGFGGVRIARPDSDGFMRIDVWTGDHGWMTAYATRAGKVARDLTMNGLRARIGDLEHALAALISARKTAAVAA